ncbi:hypothetical protein GCM10027074_28870 [Streptomyces deserti]
MQASVVPRKGLKSLSYEGNFIPDASGGHIIGVLCGRTIGVERHAPRARRSHASILPCCRLVGLREKCGAEREAALAARR